MRIILMTRYALAVLLTFSALSATAATVRYTYTGASISTWSGSETNRNSGVTTPWIPSTPVTGWIQLDTELAANLTNLDISTLITDCSFNSGLSFQWEDEAVRCAEGPGYISGITTMSVSTNAQGAITEWNLSGFLFSQLSSEELELRFSAAPLSENGEFRVISYSTGGGSSICCAINNTGSTSSVGSWSTAVVPIPGAVWLFASALGLMGWRSRR